MSLSMRRKSSVDATADAALAKMGYKSELPRNLSMMSILGLYVIICTSPRGIDAANVEHRQLLRYHGRLVRPQPHPLHYPHRWPIGYDTLRMDLRVPCLPLNCVLPRRICAVFPTAGGVYYWSAMLSTRKYAPVASFICGWLTLVGNWTVTLSINFSGGQLILSAITLWKEDFAPNAYQTVLMFWAVMLVCMSVNIFGAKYLDLINKICIYWTGASVFIILITVLTMADHRRSGAFVFGHYDASESGW